MPIDKKYLLPNYHSIADVINRLHGSNYNNRQIKHIHKGAHARTTNSIKIEIETLVGPFSDYYDNNGKPRQ